MYASKSPAKSTSTRTTTGSVTSEVSIVSVLSRMSKVKGNMNDMKVMLYSWIWNVVACMHTWETHRGHAVFSFSGLEGGDESHTHTN